MAEIPVKQIVACGKSASYVVTHVLINNSQTRWYDWDCRENRVEKGLI